MDEKEVHNLNKQDYYYTSIGKEKKESIIFPLPIQLFVFSYILGNISFSIHENVVKALKLYTIRKS